MIQPMLSLSSPLAKRLGPQPPLHVAILEGGLALGVLLFGAASKAKSQWGQISARTMLAETSRNMAKFVSDNVILAVVSFENGFFDGFSTSLWADGPVWFVWLLRVICYVFLIHQCGFWPYMMEFASVIGRKGFCHIQKRADIPLGKAPYCPNFPSGLYCYS